MEILIELPSKRLHINKRIQCSINKSEIKCLVHSNDETSLHRQENVDMRDV